MTSKTPLVLDVDGTFLRTDLSVENFWHALGRDPKGCFQALWRHKLKLAALKAELAQLAPLRTDLMPRNTDIAKHVEKARADGRDVVLASGSDQSHIKKLSDENNFGPDVFASDGTTNLTGSKKAATLTKAYGDKGFDYAGDNPKVDRAVWSAAAGAIAPNGTTDVENKIGEFSKTWNARDVMRALRPHQWVKNVLLLLALIAAHRFSASDFLTIFYAFLSFSAAASSIYIVNDLLDLEADRLHVKKKFRPFAAGTVPIMVGMVTCIALGAFALGMAAWISLPFMGVVALYMSLSLAYSLRLKRMRWVDIFVLASLYTLRVIAGAIAAEVAASGWLIAFIFPTFLALGCVKRLTELTLATSDERLPGRGYGRLDRPDLLNMASVGAFFALLMFFLYSFSVQGEALYPNTWQLWLALVPIGAWLIRMIYLGWHGKQDYDPIVFAMRDKYGLTLICVVLIIIFHAAGLIYPA